MAGRGTAPLRLTTQVRLTIVGCSGSVPGVVSGGSCYLVEAGEHRLLLDLGSGSIATLQRYTGAAQIDTIVLSHSHTDHCGDLDQFGYLRTLTPTPPVRVVGPPDLESYVWNNPEVFAATRATPQPFTIGPMTVRLAAVEHTRECWAARVGDVLCYTADSAPCPALDELADGCRVLLAEASGSDVDGPLPAHLTAGDAARLAVRSGARLLVLTHLRPWQDHGALLDEAAAIAGCPVVLAHPGLRVSLMP